MFFGNAYLKLQFKFALVVGWGAVIFVEVTAPNYIDIKSYRDEGAIEYCFKRIKDKNICNVKFIGVDARDERRHALSSPGSFRQP
jgi:hypothetical protein